MPIVGKEDARSPSALLFDVINHGTDGAVVGAHVGYPHSYDCSWSTLRITRGRQLHVVRRSEPTARHLHHSRFRVSSGRTSFFVAKFPLLHPAPPGGRFIAPPLEISCLGFTCPLLHLVRIVRLGQHRSQ